MKSSIFVPHILLSTVKNQEGSRMCGRESINVLRQTVCMCEIMVHPLSLITHSLKYIFLFTLF